MEQQLVLYQSVRASLRMDELQRSGGADAAGMGALNDESVCVRKVSSRTIIAVFRAYHFKISKYYLRWRPRWGSEFSSMKSESKHVLAWSIDPKITRVHSLGRLDL